VGTVLNVVSSGSSFTLVYVFPDGRFVSRWFRWFWLLSVVGNAVVTFASGPRLEALLLRWPWLTGVGVLFIALQLVFMAASPIYRYWRDASPIQRQQLKWVLLALMVQPILWPVGAFVIPALFPAAAQSLAGALAYNLARLTLQDFAFLLVPIAIGLAILRYRLYDIDLIIRRTLIYAVLTGLLALAYLGLVVVLQNIFGTLTGQRQSTLITVISTLVIAALFGPLRARVQVVVDQRFFRSKYDAARTVAQFGAAMRDDAAADLAQISEHLVLVVQDTLQPDQVSLWVRSAAAPAAQGEPE